MLAKIKTNRETRKVIADCLKKESLLLSHWLLLGVVATDKRKSMSEIADMLEVKLPLVSRYVKELKSRGLVKVISDDQDKRTKYVIITQEGADLLQKIEPDIKVALKQWLSHIPREHVDIYINVILLLGS